MNIVPSFINKQPVGWGRGLIGVSQLVSKQENKLVLLFQSPGSASSLETPALTSAPTATVTMTLSSWARAEVLPLISARAEVGITFSHLYLHL